MPYSSRPGPERRRPARASHEAARRCCTRDRDTRGATKLADGEQRLLEPVTLVAKHAALRNVGRRKVRVDAVEPSGCGCQAAPATCDRRLSWRKPSRFMPVSIFVVQQSWCGAVAAAACTARAAPGVEIVGVNAKSKRPSRSLTLDARIPGPARAPPACLSATPSSMSAHASILAPASCQRECDARRAVTVHVGLDDSNDVG